MTIVEINFFVLASRVPQAVTNLLDISDIFSNAGLTLLITSAAKDLKLFLRIES